MKNNRTYSVKLKVEQILGSNHRDMGKTIRDAIQFLNDYGPSINESWVEIEVVDNLTELTVFTERRTK